MSRGITVSNNGNQGGDRMFLGIWQEDVERTLRELGGRQAVQRLWDRDPGLWKDEPGHRQEISRRLGWLTVVGEMAHHVEELEAFAREVKDAGIRHVVLCGMGGSSLGAEVMEQVFGSAPDHPRFQVLDSTDPATVAEVARQARPVDSLYLIASKSGGTIEVDSLFRFFWGEAQSEPCGEPGLHFAAITDPGTTLEQLGRERGFRRIFLNPPDIGGRYSVLSLFGLVPAALMGLDLPRFLERAQQMAKACGPRAALGSNPGLWLGAALGTLARAGRDKLTLLFSPRLAGLGSWVEQLIAESTGKEGQGIVPVAGEPLGEPKLYGEDRFFVCTRLEGDENGPMDRLVSGFEGMGHPVATLVLRDGYDLGAEFFRWEFATAVAGMILKIDPFDQPNVQESKENTARVLATYQETGCLPVEMPDWTEGDLAVYGIRGPNLVTSLASFQSRIRPGDYFAIMAYLQRSKDVDEALKELRRRVRDKFQVATTLGYGPRFLHSTGQLHKGGSDVGVFLQITAEDPVAVPIPDRPYDFGILKAAQALGDWESLRRHGRRVIRAHLGKDVVGDLARLVAAMG